MDALFWWTGAATWLAIGLIAAWLAIEIAVGFAAAVSWCRWAFRIMKTHDRQPNWKAFPRTFLRRWSELVGYRKGHETTHGAGGHWRGIGDWTVYPPKVACGNRNDETNTQPLYD